MRRRLFQYDQARRNHPRYRAKKRIVKDLWIGAGTVMILFPEPAAVCAMGLLTTFLSFLILDETR
jgi:hypothetical protein